VDADSVPTPDWSAGAWPNQEANIDNRVRHVVLSSAAVLRLFAP
jgi:hypothetical protein